ncbi:MAG: hypothetical protein IJ700_08820 [Bacteroidaceae bacterium]|nr:hypothetical protein [Bacteroidaceae bacterium]MBR1683433.1 hypothetical protein [Bacteroidaceae bacterium]
MNKKTYIQPSLQVHQLNLADGILQTLSGDVLGNGGDTNSNNVTSSDTKESGNWSDIW